MEPVKELNENDVLLGRGYGSNQYIGNIRFRDLTEAYKKEYISSGRHKPKKQIAQDVLDQIHSLGGRFLQQEENQGVENIVKHGTWYVVDDKKALEKCKQALRQQREPPAVVKAVLKASENKSPPTAAHQPTSTDSSVKSGGLSVGPSVVGKSRIQKTNAVTDQSPMLIGSAAPATVDARLLLLSHADPFAFSRFNQVRPNTPSVQPQAHLSSGHIPESHPNRAFLRNPAVAVSQIAPAQSQYNTVQDNRASGQSGDTLVQEGVNLDSGVASMPNEDSPDDDDVSEFLMSILALSGRTKFSEQQDAQEKTSMTNEEREQKSSRTSLESTVVLIRAKRQDEISTGIPSPFLSSK